MVTAESIPLHSLRSSSSAWSGLPRPQADSRWMIARGNWCRLLVVAIGVRGMDLLAAQSHRGRVIAIAQLRWSAIGTDRHGLSARSFHVRCENDYMAE
jgi:hypothetical protein